MPLFPIRAPLQLCVPAQRIRINATNCGIFAFEKVETFFNTYLSQRLVAPCFNRGICHLPNVTLIWYEDSEFNSNK